MNTATISEKKIQKIAEKTAREVVLRMLKGVAEYEKMDSMASIAQKGESFDFLSKEPDLYSKKDLKK